MEHMSKIGLILIGPPGIGKGTLGLGLSKIIGFPHLSSSYLLTNLDNVTPEIRKIINSGQLVGDDTVNTIFVTELCKDMYKNGVILDGYPRTIYQADYMHNKFEKIICVQLLLDEDILLHRLSGRLVCSKCKKCYNSFNIQNGVYKMPVLMPSEEDLAKCDGCKDLKTRPDDMPDVVKKRIDLYNVNTAPLIKYYSDKNLLSKFEIREGFDDLPRLVDHVKSLM